MLHCFISYITFHIVFATIAAASGAEFAIDTQSYLQSPILGKSLGQEPVMSDHSGFRSVAYFVNWGKLMW